MPEPAALPLPDKPSIAVLPFQNMSGDPEQEYFVDGMVEEIITALSRIRWLFVIARNSSFTYKGQPVDVKQVARDLGVRYVLEGSVRKGGGRVRITAQLIECATGAHLWADRFDGSLEDVFDLQDQVATSVAGVIEPALQAAESRRAAQRPTRDLTAYDLYLRSLPIFARQTKDDVLEAAALLDRAIALDPHFSSALAELSRCHMRLAIDEWAADPGESERKAVALARRALATADNDPIVLVDAALTLACFGESSAIAFVDKALALNPSYARGWYVSGMINLMAGQPNRAIEHVERALSLSPFGFLGFPTLVRGQAHFHNRNFDAAVGCLRVCIREKPGHPWPYRHLAACLAHLGQLDEAREVIGQLRVIGAVIIPSRKGLFSLEVYQLTLSGLRLATGESA